MVNRQVSARRALRRRLAQPVALLGALACGSAWAGGYLNIATHSVTGATAPVKWSGTIPIHRDLGTLGTLSKAQADTLVASALGRWSGVTTANVAFSTSDLPSDNNGSALPGSAPNYNNTGDGYNAVIYDTDGSITAYYLGASAKSRTIGFAGIQNYFPDTATAVSGQAVLNGAFLNGTTNAAVNDPSDISQSEFEGVIVHELGHFLNLDHASFNYGPTVAINPTHAASYAGFPTMYPNVHADIATLEMDDKVWLSNLYPSATFASTTSMTTGTVFNVSGVKTNGVNLVARDTANPMQNAISCVSGVLDPTPSNTSDNANDGYFFFPGLTPGSTWVIETEQINPGHVSGSRVGPVNPQVDLSAVGAPEFVNEDGVESTSDDVARSTTFVAANGGSGIGVTLHLNGAPTVTNVAEVDTGANWPDVTGQGLTLTPGVPVQVNATINPSEAGAVDFFGSDELDIEDWYVINPAAGQELYEIVATPGDPNLDLTLYICHYFNSGSNIGAPAIAESGFGGAAESLRIPFNTEHFGDGAYAGVVYIGVSASYASTVASHNYTLRIESKVATEDAAMVTGTTPSTIDVNSGSVTINGRGFKPTPAVAFDAGSGIIVNSVTYVNSNTLNVSISRDPSWTAGPVGLTVTNAGGSGSYMGARNDIQSVPVEISAFSAE